MRLAAVCRVMNEEDIIEAFVRHTLAHVDSLLVLDTGSTDRTIDILTALKAEGATFSLLQVSTPIFHELQHSTLLQGVANTAFRPDWVLHLDADEFIDSRRAADLRTRLSALRPEVQAARLPVADYVRSSMDMTDLLVPRRIRLRDLVDHGMRKWAIRGGLQGEVAVDPGGHGGWLEGQPMLAMDAPDLRLARYAHRHPATSAAKAALVRLTVLAAGGGPGMVAQRAFHHTPVLDALCRNPAELFANPARLGGAMPGMPLVDDPIRYGGGELRYTAPGDPVMQAIRSVANAAALLAASHGRLLDESPEARGRVDAEAVRARLLFG